MIYRIIGLEFIEIFGFIFKVYFSVQLCFLMKDAVKNLMGVLLDWAERIKGE